MPIVLPSLKDLLNSLRENDWYVTAFSFRFNGHEYVVVFEDLRQIGKGSQYYAVCLTFLDINDENHKLKVLTNVSGFDISNQKILNFFEIRGNGLCGNPTFILYRALNIAIPNHYVPIARTQHKYVLDAIQKRDNDSGRCCYKVRRNGKGIDGTQKYRTAENTAKTKLLRPTLFDLVRNDKELSFCYRKENELSDAEILYNAYKQGTLR